MRGLRIMLIGLSLSPSLTTRNVYVSFRQFATCDIDRAKDITQTEDNASD